MHWFLVVSLNLKRRHLTSSQKAVIALEALPMLEAEARERQKTSEPGIYGGKPLIQKIGEAVDSDEPLPPVIGATKKHSGDANQQPR